MNANEETLTHWEANLRAAASAFPYPATPDLAASVKRRLAAEPGRPRARAPRLAWAVAVAALVVVVLLAVPQVRAGLVEFLQLGVVRIFLAAPTPTSMSAASATPPPTPTLLASLLDLAGQTRLAEARSQAGFSIRLPAYPEDLGPPDHVFVQDLEGMAVVLVWLDTDRPGGVRLSLHLLASRVMAEKGLMEKEPPRVVQFTTVHGREAAWTEGPYVVRVRNGDYDFRRLIEGHVLIWEEEGVTYRLETDLPLFEAVKIAESLK